MLPDQVVREFIALKAVSKISLFEAFDLFFSEETIWENVGLSRSRGIEEAKNVLRNAESMGVETINVEILCQFHNENIVVNERIDHILDMDGNELLALRAMGIFEVSGDKIVGWRDYCDTAALRMNN